ncbi:hypothetical protein LXL04_012466 [Taraxacum kok-saghyz]
MQKLAKELGVVIPVYNSIAIIDADGTDLGIYRKSHIPDGPGYEEKFYFNPRDTGFKQYVGTIGFRKLQEPWFFKVQNYYFNPLLSALNLKTKVLIHVTIGIASCKAMLALIWSVPLIASNRIGNEVIKTEHGDSSITFYGNSFIAGPTGETITCANDKEEAMLLAKLYSISNYQIVYIQPVRAFICHRLTSHYIFI